MWNVWRMHLWISYLVMTTLSCRASTPCTKVCSVLLNYSFCVTVYCIRYSWLCQFGIQTVFSFGAWQSLNVSFSCICFVPTFVGVNTGYICLGTVTADSVFGNVRSSLVLEVCMCVSVCGFSSLADFCLRFLVDVVTRAKKRKSLTDGVTFRGVRRLEICCKVRFFLLVISVLKCFTQLLSMLLLCYKLCCRPSTILNHFIMLLHQYSSLFHYVVCFNKGTPLEKLVSFFGLPIKKTLY